MEKDSIGRRTLAWLRLNLAILLIATRISLASPNGNNFCKYEGEGGMN